MFPAKANRFSLKGIFKHGFKRPGLSLGVVMLVLLPLAAYSQAGSSPSLRFNAPDSHSSGSASSSYHPMLPAGVLKLAGEERYLIWVDLELGKLNILERNEQGGMELRQVIPVSIGKNGFGKEKEGDKKTPVGVYRLTSFLSDEQLIDFYGLGAFPLNYPNVIDRKAQRTGSGIWLHGLPKDVTTRPLLDSDGCVVIDNESFSEINKYITPGITHMVLSESPISWVASESINDRRSALTQAFEGWRRAWEAKDNPEFLSYYADDFSDFIRNKTQWSDYKSRVNNGKKWIEVEASKVSFYADLEHPELVTVRYYQNYKSSNYQWLGWKEQLWRESPEGWQIVFEGNG
ncbi:MAG: L,D-transpeptidase family protein [Gammaproteobacteria bacterium]|nr:L,D-transpeptidase family protein [Gammaproteobacteria bacterium]